MQPGLFVSTNDEINFIYKTKIIFCVFQPRITRLCHRITPELFFSLDHFLFYQFLHDHLEQLDSLIGWSKVALLSLWGKNIANSSFYVNFFFPMDKKA
jgi:hypothetical protein